MSTTTDSSQTVNMPLPYPNSLITTFSRALTSFQSSPDTLRILCTLPHVSNTPAPRRPSHPVRDLIILDSSFNPPTLAHAGMARSALQAHGSSRLMLLLSVNNADKAPKPASFPVRLGMMEALGRELVGEVEGLEVDVAVTTMPFFHDKAKAIVQSGFYGDATQTFLAGFDTLVRIFNPKYYGEGGMRLALGPFFDAAKVRVTTRPDETWGGVEEQRAWLTGAKLGEVGGDDAWVGRVEIVEGDEGGEGVSSSRVREVVKSGDVEELDGLVSEEIKGWIEREGLYREVKDATL
ncbi:hypothetical protein BHE90_013106 [Fusarium euwallaceae]|uniref:Cytidyltransferase-like domain-containing protein n=1 Tax=Fusarium euwallaceae TaxID=1147111 RepID=A0A430L9R8_9HYPO|nr:hypothetical protein BHE90_013106 [Fusarium euwallaceae]